MFLPHIDHQRRGVAVKAISNLEIAFARPEQNMSVAAYEDLMTDYWTYAIGKRSEVSHVAMQASLTRTCYSDVEIEGWSLALTLCGIGWERDCAHRAWWVEADLLASYLGQGSLRCSGNN